MGIEYKIISNKLTRAQILKLNMDLILGIYVPIVEQIISKKEDNKLIKSKH